jgi:hypothetical protein
MESYAIQAKDPQLISHATEIRRRAVRRLGKIMREQKETVGLNKGGRPKTGSPTGRRVLRFAMASRRSPLTTDDIEHLAQVCESVFAQISAGGSMKIEDVPDD